MDFDYIEMMCQKNEMELINLLRSSIADLKAVYLFGSRATKEDHSQSDWDIALLTETKLDNHFRWKLAQQVARLLHADIDLVDLRNCSAVLRAEVLRTGSILVDDSPNERARFEMFALADYARLNEERKAILQDIKERGNVYG